jgi:hypothetical protein
MSTIRMRPKHQVTLPAGVVRQANIQTDDVLSVVYLNGLMSFAGIGKGLWGDSPEAVDASLRDMKDAWQR